MPTLDMLYILFFIYQLSSVALYSISTEAARAEAAVEAEAVSQGKEIPTMRNKFSLAQKKLSDSKIVVFLKTHNWPLYDISSVSNRAMG